MPGLISEYLLLVLGLINLNTFICILCKMKLTMIVIFTPKNLVLTAI